MDLSWRLGRIMYSLREIIGTHAGRHPASVAVITLLWSYLHRVEKRFAALARRVEAGGAAGAPARTSAASLAPRLPQFGPPCPRRPGLPTKFCWLILLVPYHAACIAGQVRHLLMDPEMAALFAAAPQAGRIFRPLCRMLGIAPERGLPPELFRPPVPRRLPTAPDACGSALTPTLFREREREKQARERDLPVTRWSIAGLARALAARGGSSTPALSRKRERESRTRPRLPIVREAPA
jgi:hypothetical protein